MIGEKQMRKLFKKNPVGTCLITAMAFALLAAGPAAMAQTGSPGAPNKPSTFREAPVGHRQPRADQVPSEKNLSDPNKSTNKEDAALDRKLRSICRGC
jgi:hypothetical protein